MNTYMNVSVTCFAKNPELNYGYLFVSIESCKLVIAHRIKYEDAQVEILKLAKCLGRAPEIKANPHDPTITYREISGFLE